MIRSSSEDIEHKIVELENIEVSDAKIDQAVEFVINDLVGLKTMAIAREELAAEKEKVAAKSARLAKIDTDRIAAEEKAKSDKIEEKNRIAQEKKDKIAREKAEADKKKLEAEHLAKAKAKREENKKITVEFMREFTSPTSIVNAIINSEFRHLEWKD